jgi:hypothetical protein
MAPFVPFPGGVQVELLFLLDGQIVENRLWFWQVDFPHTSAELLNLADGVYVWHTTYILPYLSQDLQLVTIVATDWSAAGGPFEVTTGPVVNGGVAEESLSANVAVVVPFRWALQYGREKRNKNYVPGIPDSAVQLNTVQPTFQDAMFEGYSALIDFARLISPGDYWYWVTASAIDDNAPRSEMLFGQSTGTAPRPGIILGQRRKRLPPS